MSTPEAQLTDWLREAERVMAFCGAGVSAESGVPTFRGAGGLWEGHRIEDVAMPEGFQRDPQAVWRFYVQRQEQLQTVRPNPAHEVLAAMEDRYAEFLLVTQNVDDLHERAGSRKLVKLHGSLMETRCTRCATVTALEAPVSLAEGLPHCDCGGLLRPNVVWFGEYLNPNYANRMTLFFHARGAPGALLLLIIGTSGVVSIGYGITDLARAAGGRIVEINPEETEHSHQVDLAVRAPAGELLRRVWPRVIAAAG